MLRFLERRSCALSWVYVSTEEGELRIESGREEKNKSGKQEANETAYPTELWLQFRYMRGRVA